LPDRSAASQNSGGRGKRQEKPPFLLSSLLFPHPAPLLPSSFPQDPRSQLDLQVYVTMNPLDSFVDFISSTNEQPLEWSKMARILDQIKDTYPISERLSRRVNEVGSFLHENWAVIGNRSKTLVYRKLKHVSNEATAETGDASQLIEIMVSNHLPCLEPPSQSVLTLLLSSL